MDMTELFKTLTNATKTAYKTPFGYNPNTLYLGDFAEDLVSRNAWTPTMGQLTGTAHTGFTDGIHRGFNLLKDANRIKGIPFINSIK